MQIQSKFITRLNLHHLQKSYWAGEGSSPGSRCLPAEFWLRRRVKKMKAKTDRKQKKKTRTASRAMLVYSVGISHEPCSLGEQRLRAQKNLRSHCTRSSRKATRFREEKKTNRNCLTQFQQHLPINILGPEIFLLPKLPTFGSTHCTVEHSTLGSGKSTKLVSLH